MKKIIYAAILMITVRVFAEDDTMASHAVVEKAFKLKGVTSELSSVSKKAGQKLRVYYTADKKMLLMLQEMTPQQYDSSKSAMKQSMKLNDIKGVGLDGFQEPSISMMCAKSATKAYCSTTAVQYWYQKPQPSNSAIIEILKSVL